MLAWQMGPECPPPPHLFGSTVQGFGAADVKAEQNSIGVAVAEGPNVVIIGGS